MGLVFRFLPLAATQAAAQLVRHAGGRLNYRWLMQLLYLVDRRSLLETGRPLTGARAINTEIGPTLMGADESQAWAQCFRREGDDVVLLMDPGDDELSEYDVEVLEQVYAGGRVSDLTQLPEWWKDPAPEESRPITWNDVLLACALPPEAIEHYEQLNAAVRALDPVRVVRDKLPPSPGPYSDAELQKSCSWAIRALRFTDEGLLPGTREALRESRLEGNPPGPWVPPRSDWGDGPWMAEPDVVEWRTGGVPYPMMIIRGSAGALCGYVGLPPGHPFHGRSDLVGEATWMGPSNRMLFATGEPPNFWWYGLDCGHSHELTPGVEAAFTFLRKLAGPGLLESTVTTGRRTERRYVPLEECRRRTEALARELLKRDVSRRHSASSDQ